MYDLFAAWVLACASLADCATDYVCSAGWAEYWSALAAEWAVAFADVWFDGPELAS